MTIAIGQYEGVGARLFNPEGPFGAAGQTPLPNFKPGTVIAGDAEAEFVYLIFAPTAAVTLNQGDALWWDNSYTATQTGTGAGSASFGADVGTFFLGGRVGDPGAAQGNYWSWTFQPGVYGIWVQRAGTSLLNLASINAQTKPVNSTATAGQLNQPASPLAGSMGIANIWSAPSSGTFTANTTSGSATLTNVSTCKFLAKGQIVSGTGIATGSYITDIQGATVTLSAAATANGTGTTITASNNATTGNVTSGSTAITGVATIAGVYPNQTIAGTGIPASTTITSITGTPGNYTINLSAAATATNSGVSLTTTGYFEAYLRWPCVQSQN